MSFHYFAYGSVMSIAHAREWCDSHGMDVVPFLQGVPARLPGFKLVFRVPSRFWQGLVADIEPDEGASVEGVLFTLSEESREAVYRKEGAATGLYHELTPSVALDGKAIQASVYQSEPQKRASEGPVSARYLDTLIEGAQERGLSPEWIRFLESHTRDDGRPPPPGISLGVKKS